MSTYILLEADKEDCNGYYKESEEFISKEDRDFKMMIMTIRKRLVFTERSIKS